MSALRRAAPSSLAALAAACGTGTAPAPGPPALVLWDVAGSARVERDAPAPELAARVLAVRDGTARIEVALRPAEGREILTGPGRRLAFELPLGAAPGPAELAGPDGAALRDGVELSVAGTRAFAAFAPDAELPDVLLARYPVRAALLAGRATADELAPAEVAPADFAPADFTRGVLAAGDVARDALFAPAGGRLRVPLPAFAGGRLAATLELCDGAGPVRARLSLGGTALAELSLPRAGAAARVDAPVPACAQGAELELAVEGPDGCAVALTGAVLARPPAPGDPPDLLLVLVDTLRADRLGPWGERGLTPRLDRFAEGALVLGELWSTSSWTLPAVASLLTSRHAEEHGARARELALAPGLDTLASLLRGAGYRTAAVTDGGFVHPAFGLQRGFLDFDARGGALGALLGRAGDALDAAGDAPWLLLVHTYAVHSPYEPPAAAAERVRALRGDVLGDRVAGPEHVADLVRDDGDRLRAPRELCELLAALYDEEVRALDAELGAFLEARAADLAGAVVALVADHGEEFGEHGLLGHSDTLYREALHVPGVLRFPAGSPFAALAGTRDDRPASTLDLAPTLLDALGLPELAARSSLGGTSLLGRDRSPVWATRFHPGAGLLRALRAGDLVWIEGAYRAGRGARSPELYDLSRDPGELANRADERADDARRLGEEGAALGERFGRPRARPEPAALSRESAERLRDLGYL